jgi:antitoxin ChpS
MLAVPPALLDILHLRPGARVGITVESGRLIVEPERRRRYTMDELLAQCHPKARRASEEREWLTSVLAKLAPRFSSKFNERALSGVGPAVPRQPSGATDHDQAMAGATPCLSSLSPDKRDGRCILASVRIEILNKSRLFCAVDTF